jgi:hypothetical protein
MVSDGIWWYLMVFDVFSSSFEDRGCDAYGVEESLESITASEPANL